MKLVLIPAGKFRMGSSPEEIEHLRKESFPGFPGWEKLETPQQEVRITRPFYLGAFEVTKGQFAAFVKDTAFQTEGDKAGDKIGWRNPGFDQTDDEPVVGVTWNDAEKFCRWLTRKEGRTYDLPTDAQWEYACRAGTTTVFFFGDDPKSLGDYAWHGENSGKRTHPVGGKKPNPWGLYDMYGNVREWCRDGLRPYATEAVEDPMGPEIIDGKPGRVFRGSDFGGTAWTCRSAGRLPRDATQRTNHSGFRVVCEWKAQE
jgi:formylglycine-generating enzyme required for sulfatase activity